LSTPVEISNLARIDRSSPVPFYFQLTRLLEKEITEGRWLPGHRLPSENEMCAVFGLSRATVRQAMDALETDGRVVREKGRGTFIASAGSRSWLLQSSESFFSGEVDRMGHTVSSEVTRAGFERLPTAASDALGTLPNSDGVVLERLRYVDGELALFVINYLPARFSTSVLEVDLGSDSLYERLAEHHGVSVFGGHRSLEAVQANQKLADLLHVPLGTPLVYVESTSWDRDLEPFDHYQAWLRSDLIKIEVQVVSSQGG
jgi:GntR family transcriptional regulator